MARKSRSKRGGGESRREKRRGEEREEEERRGGEGGVGVFESVEDEIDDGEEDDGGDSVSSSEDSELAITEGGSGLTLEETLAALREEAEGRVEESSDDGETERPAKKFKRVAGTAHPRKKNEQWKKRRYRNKQRTLVFGSRGLSTRFRHLMNDLRLLLPHSKKEVKMDRKDKLYLVNEIAELKSCSSVIFFEARKAKDLYLWVSRIPNGPSVKFHVQNIHTLDELKLTGNCLRGSRPVLAFDSAFDEIPALSLVKEIFISVFGTPNRHPKSKPFVDHVMNFGFVDGKIWFRNYQMFDEQVTARDADLKMVEIGPRMVLNIVRVFKGSFSGATLYENPDYVSPNRERQIRKRQSDLQKQVNRKRARQGAKRSDAVYNDEADDLADVFA